MKHLFVARHGLCGGNDRIDEDGTLQMELLGEAIKRVLNGGSAYILSSTAPRALDSSRVLAVQLSLPSKFEQVPYIWSGTDAPADSFYHIPSLDRLMGIVDDRRDKADGLVMVTHLEVTEDFPSYFIKKEFGQDARIRDIPKGKAVHIDLKNKNYQILPS